MLDPSCPEALRQTTEKLVSIPSVSSRVDLCHEVLDFITSSIPNLDSFHTEVYEVDGTKSLIVGTREGRAAPLILNGHIDVVPAHTEQFTPQLKEGGKLWGRGTYDMKGAVAVYVELLKKLSKIKADQRPHFQVQFVSDEEIGGHRGVEPMVTDGFNCELFLAGEPTDLRISNQAKGTLWVKVVARGEPGHSARPWLCRNPLVSLSRGLHHLYGRFPVPGEAVWATTATVTGIDVGENSHNRVPDKAVCKIDLRYIPQDDPQELIAFLKGIFPNSDLEVIQIGPTLYTPEDNAHLKTCQDVGARVLGQTPDLFNEHFASDARYYSAAGTPALCWGPSGAGMHANDEHLKLESLSTYASIIDQLIYADFGGIA